MNCPECGGSDITQTKYRHSWMQDRFTCLTCKVNWTDYLPGTHLYGIVQEVRRSDGSVIRRMYGA